MFERVEAMLVAKEDLQGHERRQKPESHRQHHAGFIHRSALADQPGGDPDHDKTGRNKEADDSVRQAIGEGRAEDDREPILGEEAPVDDLVAGRRLHPAIGGENPERGEERLRLSSSSYFLFSATNVGSCCGLR
jgi:hypothetical protein